MKLSLITDEITQDIDEAIRFALEYRLDGLELRSVCDTPIDQIPPATLKDWKALLDEKGLSVCSLASNYNKCGITPWEQKANTEKLERLCNAADTLGCKRIRGFAFFAPEGGILPPMELAPLFKEPARYLEARGKFLLLEADPSVNTTNHRQLASLLRLIASPSIMAIYDPGNDIYDPCGELPYPDGYLAVRPYLRHIHIKDCIHTPDGPECVKPGTGLVPYRELLTHLMQDGWQGWLSLETHYRVSAVLTEEQMRLPHGSGFSRGGWDAAAESIESLRLLMRQARAAATGCKQ